MRSPPPQQAMENMALFNYHSEQWEAQAKHYVNYPEYAAQHAVRHLDANTLANSATVLCLHCRSHDRSAVTTRAPTRGVELSSDFTAFACLPPEKQASVPIRQLSARPMCLDVHPQL